MDINEVAKKHNLSLVVLFGSRARGDTHAHSDMDVAFLSQNNLSLDEELSIISDLGSVLKMDIDSVNLRRATPLISYHIFRHGKPLYEIEPGIFSEYLVRSYRIYEETAPLYEARLAML